MKDRKKKKKEIPLTITEDGLSERRSFTECDCENDVLIGRYQKHRGIFMAHIVIVIVLNKRHKPEIIQRKLH